MLPTNYPESTSSYIDTPEEYTKTKGHPSGPKRATISKPEPRREHDTIHRNLMDVATQLAQGRGIYSGVRDTYLGGGKTPFSRFVFASNTAAALMAEFVTEHLHFDVHVRSVKMSSPSGKAGIGAESNAGTINGAQVIVFHPRSTTGASKNFGRYSK